MPDVYIDGQHKTILDPCCGGRMFYFDKQNPAVLYCDNRKFDGQIWQSKDGTQVRMYTVKPDMICDVTQLPFENESFYHVVFDPPHIIHAGENSWLAKKYGKLPQDWRPFVRDGFNECWRVLKPNGTLVFKWSEDSIPVKDIISAIGQNPLYGNRSGKHSKTHWMCFVKTA